MGSSTKKHKKDRDSKKHKRKSRSPVEIRVVREVIVANTSRKNQRSTRSDSESNSSSNQFSSSRRSSRSRERDRDRDKRRHHKKHGKEHKKKDRSRSGDERSCKRTTILVEDEYNSDSSDCIEVPLAPPAPIISKPSKEPSPPITRQESPPVITRKERSPVAPRPLNTKRDKSPVNSRRERSPVATRRERSPIATRRERSPIATRRERSPVATRRERSPVATRRERSPVATRRDRSPAASRRDKSPSNYRREKSPGNSRYQNERLQERNSRHEQRDRSPNHSTKQQQQPRNENRRSPSPIPEKGAGDCLSIDETNKLRAKLGLKPLEVDTSTPIATPKDKNSASSGKLDKSNQGLSSYKDEWGEFLHKPANNIAKKAKEDKIREKLKQSKEKRALESKLKKLKGLGESDEEVDDINKWVNRSKEKEELRKEADKRAKVLEEMDAEFGVSNLIQDDKKKTKNQAYRDNDLKGLRVEHDVDEFIEGKSVILTLKDKGVLDEDDDALINVNMIDNERYKKNIENKKLNPQSYGYDVYEESFDVFGNPIERSILGKYDEEIDKESGKKTFTIGSNAEEEIEHRRKLLEIKTKLSGKRLETLQDTALKLATDTYSEVELAKFRKPKKKVKKIRQKLKADDLIPIANPITSSSTSSKDFGSRKRDHDGKSRNSNDNKLSTPIITDDTANINEDIADYKYEIDDEDDFQICLSKARRLKQQEAIIRKPIEYNPDDYKQEIKNEPDSNDENNDVDDNDDAMNGGMKDNHITLNATAEFCRTLGDIPTYGMAGNRNEDSNDMMDYEAEPNELEKKYEENVNTGGTWNSVNPDLQTRGMDDEEISNDIAEVAILDEEPDVGAGVAAALRLALSKGYLEKDDLNRPSNAKMSHLQAKNYTIDDKAYGEEEKQYNRRDRYHGPISEFRDKDNFKPNVKLDYIDDNGRILSAKEAFRYLSHKFHGKGPGKNKIEKRLKKMEQEGLMKTMSSTDTPLGTLTMLQQKQKDTQTPYVVLSGGKQTQLNTTTTISKHNK